MVHGDWVSVWQSTNANMRYLENEQLSCAYGALLNILSFKKLQHQKVHNDVIT